MRKEPGYCRHRPSGNAYVSLNGKAHYLGKYGTKESREAYDRLKAEWHSNRGAAKFSKSVTTMAEVCLAYLDHAEEYYRVSTELSNIKMALKPVSEIYANLAADKLSPLEYETINLKPTPIYRIAKWTETFETADSRRHKSLHWVSVPNDFTSNGYAQLVEEFGDEAAAIYGGWIALAKIASTCPVRGILSTSSGVGLSVGRLSFISHFPSSVFEKLIGWATREGVSWLEEVSSEELNRLLNDCQPVDDQSDSNSDQVVQKPQKRREKPPIERQSFVNQSPNELPNQT